MPIRLVKVQALSARLKAAYASDFHLEYEKACKLQKSGEIRIVDSGVAPSAPLSVRSEDRRLSYLYRPSFIKHDKRIAWVQDFSRMGGAELSNIAVVKRGVEIGFDVVGVTPDNFKPDILKGADIIILNNLFEFKDDQFRNILWELFEHRKPFIKYDHDLRELKRLNKTRPLFERSMLNIFISPLHKKLYEKEFIYGDALPLAIDVSAFNNAKQGNRVDQTIIPAYHKGRANHDAYIAGHRKEKFVKFDQEKKTTHEEIIKLMQGSTKVLHLPCVPWAGDRVYFEALLSGCEIVANDNVGHKSWPPCTALAGWLDASLSTFWEMAGKI